MGPQVEMPPCLTFFSFFIYVRNLKLRTLENPQHVDTDFRKMLDRSTLDLVSICAYAPDRLEMCEVALRAGAKGLWIEKTLGCSLAEAIRIGELARESGAKAVVDYPRRARAPFRVVKRAIENDTLGKLQSVTCHMTHQLLHTGTHAFDILRYWCGEVTSVMGRLEYGFEGNEIQDQGGVAQMEFESGTTAFVSAKKKKYYIFQFDLLFENGRILLGNDIQKVYLPDQSKLYSGFKELFESDGFSWKDPHRENLLQDLIDSIERDTEPLCSIENAIEALRIGLAIFYSHRENARWVTPDEVPTDFRISNK
jgi:predicted dehydrogenase